ncbi:MAG TPA: protein kinase [Bryobacteraceae bacterium]
MTPERQRQIDDLYRAALEQQPGRRHDFLVRICGQDEDLRRALEARFAQSQEPTASLSHTAEWGRAARSAANLERQRKLDLLYRAALAQPPDQRRSFLAGACGDDEELRAELQSRFAHSGETTASLPEADEWGQYDRGPVLPPGTRLGPYEIVGPLGRGGMGTVYRGVDTRLDRPVAIKVSAERFGGHFESEARAISALNHPHVCTLYDVGPNYLVMELLEGETLSARLRKGVFEPDQVLRYGAQIADALAAAHAHEIVHRDLKPANIMITEQGIKVLDFGVAKSAERPGAEPETHPGEDRLMGTVAYMAPEQLDGRECDARTDIFALGLVLSEMAMGARMPAGVGSAASAKGAPTSLEAVSPKLARLVRRCLQHDPSLRWQTAPEVKLALERALAKSGTARTRLLVAAVIAGLTVGAAIWAFSVLRQNPDQTLHSIPFTTFAGGQYEPAFSSDGSRVAFVWDNEKADVFNVYTKAVAGGDPQRITTSPVSEGSPCWSPDGGRIAFLRYAAAPGEAGVFVVSSSGGSSRRVTKTFSLPHIYDRYLDWSPDGKYLAVADKESAEQPFSIFLIALETGERRKITDPPVANTGDTGPAFAPDSKTLSFRRTVSSGVADLFLVPITGGQPRRLTNDNRHIEGHAWTADGREIVVSSHRANDVGLWRIPVHGGEPRSIPSLRTSANFLAISRAGQRLAFSHWFIDSNIWQFHPGAAGEARKLIASTRDDRSPQYSPDGSRIAFRSDRSGANEIWVTDSSGGHAVELTKFDGPLTGSPHWSPDGTWIAFDSRPSGNGDIFVIPSGGGTPRRITYDRADDVTPSWSSDGRWIYFASNRTGTYQVWKIAAAADENKGQAVQVTEQGGFQAQESAADGSLFYAKGPGVPGIWKIAPGGREEPVLKDYPAGYWGYWCLLDGGIYFATPSAGKGAVLEFLDLGTRHVRRLMDLERPPLFSDSGLSVIHGGGTVLYTQADSSGSEIMLVEGFR